MPSRQPAITSPCAAAYSSWSSYDRESERGLSGRRAANFTHADSQPLRNQSGVANGRMYSGHALDQMQHRGITPSVVENAIQNGTASAGPSSGTTAYFDAANGIRVILDTKTGTVVTVMYTKSPKKPK